MFEDFPSIEYPLDGYQNQVTKITTAFLLQRYHVDNAFVFQTYTLRDLQDAIQLSKELYGNVDYYWTLFMVNNIINPYKDWFVDQYLLNDYAESKYPDGANGIHHYFDVDDDRICDDMTDSLYREMDPESLPAHIRPVTNYEWELEQNEGKREVSVVHPQAIRTFVDDFKDMLNNLEEGT